jgi:outer membrane biosynthesis protein TonB
MKYFTFLIYTLIFITITIPVGIVIFDFFDIRFDVYGSYLLWFIALALFNALLPYQVKDIYANDPTAGGKSKENIVKNIITATSQSKSAASVVKPAAAPKPVPAYKPAAAHVVKPAATPVVKPAPAPIPKPVPAPIPKPVPAPKQKNKPYDPTKDKSPTSTPSGFFSNVMF